MFYIVTESTPGYLPETEPYVTHVATDAAAFLRSLVDSWTDTLTDPDGGTLSDSLPNADDILATVGAALTDEFLSHPERGFTFTATDPDAIAPLPRVWEIVASDTHPDDVRGDCTPGPDDYCTGGCITRPHAWSASGARCTRTDCNVAGTGDPCNDGNCLGTD